MRMLESKNVVIWLTGLPCSGKSTLANTFIKSYPHFILLDGDNVRQYISSDLDFSLDSRQENVRRVASFAKLLLDQNISSIVSILSPLESHRNLAKNIIGDSFKLIYLDTALDICERRDVKGMYKKARQGKINDFTGIDSPYEVPENAEIHVNTADNTAQEAADYILEMFIK